VPVDQGRNSGHRSQSRCHGVRLGVAALAVAGLSLGCVGESAAHVAAGSAPVAHAAGKRLFPSVIENKVVRAGPTTIVHSGLGFVKEVIVTPHRFHGYTPCSGGGVDPTARNRVKNFAVGPKGQTKVLCPGYGTLANGRRRQHLSLKTACQLDTKFGASGQMRSCMSLPYQRLLDKYVNAAIAWSHVKPGRIGRPTKLVLLNFAGVARAGSAVTAVRATFHFARNRAVNAPTLQYKELILTQHEKGNLYTGNSIPHGKVTVRRIRY